MKKRSLSQSKLDEIKIKSNIMSVFIEGKDGTQESTENPVKKASGEL